MSELPEATRTLLQDLRRFTADQLELLFACNCLLDTSYSPILSTLEPDVVPLADEMKQMLARIDAALGVTPPMVGVY